MRHHSMPASCLAKFPERQMTDLSDIAELRKEARRFKRMAKRQTNERIAGMLLKHARYLGGLADDLNAEWQQLNGCSVEPNSGTADR